MNGPFNRDRFRQVMGAIRANPQAWIQHEWHSITRPVEELNPCYGRDDRWMVDRRSTYTRSRNGLHPDPIYSTSVMGVGTCGTAHCVAGWAQILAGKEEDSSLARGDGLAFLGMDDFAAFSPWIFRAERTWEDLLAVERGELDPYTGYSVEREQPA